MDWSVNNLTELATVITAGVAVIALGGAVWQVVVGRRSQREATASGLYGQYLTLAVEHPLLASGRVTVPAPGESTTEQFERYEWFVSVMLHAFEQILDLTGGDAAWRKALADQIDDHKEYLASPRFIREHYSEELQAMFPEAMAPLVGEASPPPRP